MAKAQTIIPKNMDLESLAGMISKMSKLDRFIITGGNVIDPFFGGTLNLSDIDLVVEANSDEFVSASLQAMNLNGFKVSSITDYLIQETHEAKLVVACKNEIALDIAFVNDPTLAIGPLDALSMYYLYPENKLIDDYSCIEAIKKKRFNCLPGKSYGHENPYIIVSRLLYVCSKYNAPLANQGSLIVPFNSIKMVYPIDSPFRERAKRSFQSRVLDAILLSKDRVRFTEELINSSLLKFTYDQADIALRVMTNGKLLGTLLSATTRSELETAILAVNDTT